MDIVQPSKGKAVSWQYLPEADTLLLYLDRKYWVELSKCCKRYRNQLMRRVFEELDLGYWHYNIWRIYDILPETHKIEKIPELLKSDLGCKLKLVKSVILCCDMTQEFAATFVKLLPNIKTLILFENCNDACSWEQGLITVLSCMNRLEHVKLCRIYEPREDYSTRKQIFPKSLKSLNVYFSKYSDYENESMGIYDTIDISYVNLYSLKIVSNRMLQNLSSEIPNLQEVKIEIDNIRDLSILKINEFLKANPQLKKLSMDCVYNKETLNTVLSSKSLESLCVDYWGFNAKEANNLPSNYSIKHFKFSGHINGHSTLQVINACKILKTLHIDTGNFEKLDLSKFERRINILKFIYGSYIINTINQIDSSRLFNQIHLSNNGFIGSFKNIINEYNNGKLKNYNIIPLISGAFTLKLINKND